MITGCQRGASQIEDVLKDIFSDSFVAARRYHLGYLLQTTLPVGTAEKSMILKNILQFALSCGNGKHPQERLMEVFLQSLGPAFY
jgi:hypothetical protein